ncbi:hypothetical protein FACS1894178_6950 [Bacteroidia bacterium]|nr:hypothetical protein FACS1894178_6950 [Bacteroidia bacterium]
MREQTISVSILGKKYAMTVESEEKEAIIRKAAAMLNDSGEKFKKYVNDERDILALVALENTSLLLANQKNSTFKNNEFISKLKEIDNILTIDISK